MATWPQDRDLVVAELDPAGAIWGSGSTWPPSRAWSPLRPPGAVSSTRHVRGPYAAAAVRRSAGGRRRRRPLSAVLVGPVAADQAGAALAALRGVLPGVLSSLGADVLVDCGRLDPGSAVHDVVTEADLVVVVARPVVAEVHHLAARLSACGPRRCRCC